MTSLPKQIKLSRQGIISGNRLAINQTRNESERTIKEINSFLLEHLVSSLKDGPHRGRDGAELECQVVDEVVHVIELVEKAVFEAEHDNRNDDFPDLSKDFQVFVDTVNDLLGVLGKFEQDMFSLLTVPMVLATLRAAKLLSSSALKIRSSRSAFSSIWLRAALSRARRK